MSCLGFAKGANNSLVLSIRVFSHKFFPSFSQDIQYLHYWSNTHSKVLTYVAFSDYNSLLPFVMWKSSICNWGTFYTTNHMLLLEMPVSEDTSAEWEKSTKFPNKVIVIATIKTKKNTYATHISTIKPGNYCTQVLPWLTWKFLVLLPQTLHQCPWKPHEKDSMRTNKYVHSD